MMASLRESAGIFRTLRSTKTSFEMCFNPINYISLHCYNFALGSACPTIPLTMRSSTSASPSPSSSSTSLVCNPNSIVFAELEAEAGVLLSTGAGRGIPPGRKEPLQLPSQSKSFFLTFNFTLPCFEGGKGPPLDSALESHMRPCHQIPCILSHIYHSSVLVQYPN